MADSAREGSIRPDVPTARVLASIDGLIWAACRAVGDGELGVVQAQDLVRETIANGLPAEKEERVSPFRIDATDCRFRRRS